MAHAKRNDLTDGAVISSLQSPQPPSPSRFTAAATALRSTAARVAAAATSVLTSPSKNTDITANNPHDNAFLGDPNLEEINYEEEEEDKEEEEVLEVLFTTSASTSVLRLVVKELLTKV